MLIRILIVDKISFVDCNNFNTFDLVKFNNITILSNIVQVLLRLYVKFLYLRQPEGVTKGDNMDKIIKAANFQHVDSDDLQYQFRDQLENWRETNGEHVTLDAILAALKVAQEKICRPDFPSESTSGYWSGYYLFQCLKETIRYIVGSVECTRYFLKKS